VHGTRSAKVLAASVPEAFRAAFPSGAQVESDRNAWTGEIQLPTRFATVIAKYWNGSDLRFYFLNELFSNFNDTAGLTGTATAQSIDGSSTVVFGLLGGVPRVGGDPLKTKDSQVVKHSQATKQNNSRANNFKVIPNKF